MKKILSIFSCLIFLFVMTGCGNKNREDALKFKTEYEALNENSIELSIDENNPIKYVNFTELEQVLNNGTGVIYFGFPACPWCRNILPVLFDVAEENNVDTIYYANPREIKNDMGNYEKLKSMLNEYLEENDEGEKTLYVPDVYFICDGKIVGHHLSSVSSQIDPYTSLNEEQVIELKKIYQDLFDKIK